MRKMFTRLFSLTLLLCMVGVVTELSAQCDVAPLTESNVELVTDPATVCDGGDLLYRVVGYPGAMYAFNLDGDLPGGYTADSTVSVPEGTSFTVQVQVDDTCYSNELDITNPSVIEPVMIAASEVEHPLCFGQSGEITINFTGNHAPYQYYIVPDSIWQNGALTPLTNPEFLSNYEVFSTQIVRAEGSYWVAVQDANDCVNLTSEANWDSTWVNPAPTQLVVTDVNGTDPLCVGAEGLVTVTVQAGTGTPYSTGEYTVEVGDSSKMTTLQVATFMMTAGEYTATVIDSNMCEVVSDSSAVLVDPEAITFKIDVTDVSCGDSAANDGVIKVFDFSPAGTYEAKVGDSAWVAQTGDTIFIENLEPIYYSLFVDNLDDVCDSVAYDNPNGTGNVITLQAPGEIMYEVTYNDTIICYGDSTMITVENVTGGSGNYEYYLDSDNGLVSDWSSTYSWKVGADDEFEVSVRDADQTGCEVPYPEFDIEQIGQVDIHYVNTTAPTCVGGNDGLIEIFAFHGNGTYEYSINGTAWYTNNKFARAAGDYTARVRDPLCPDYVYEYDVTVYEYDANDLWLDWADTLVCEGQMSTGFGGYGDWEQAYDEGRNVKVYYTASMDQVYVSGTVMWDHWDGSTLHFGTNEPYIAPGTYYIWAEDNFGCVFDADVDGTADYLTITVKENITPTVTATITDEASCFEDNDGVLTLHLVGEAQGTLNYALANTLQAAENITIGLTWPTDADSVNVQVGKGTYYAVLQDGACDDSTRSISGPFVVEGYDAVTITDTAMSVTDIVCYGDSAGVIEVFPAEGGSGDLVYTLYMETGMMSYVVVEGYEEVTTTTFTGLKTGWYHVEVTDLAGCEGASTNGIWVDSPDAPVYLYDSYVNDISCNGASDGTVGFWVEGGTAPYYYKIGTTNWQKFPANSWAKAGHTQEVLITEPGDYTVWLRDTLGCMAEPFEITIDEPDAIVLVAEGMDVTSSCAVDPNGMISGTVDGGNTDTFMVEIIGIDTITIYTDSIYTTLDTLAAGTYTVVATEIDGNGCYVMKEVVIDQPGALKTVAVIQDSVHCNGSNEGVIVVTEVTGGVAPFELILAGAAADTMDYDAEEVNKFDMLEAGTYSVTVVDAEGCEYTVSNLVVSEPDMLELEATWMSNITCDAAGQFSVQATGGVGDYRYYAALSELPDHILIPDSDSAAWQTDSIFSVTEAGTYIVWAIDGNDCVIGGEENDMGQVVNEWRVKVEEPEIVVSFDKTLEDAPLCNGDMDAMIIVSNVVVEKNNVALVDPEYTIVIDGMENDTVSNLGAGTYYITVTHDASGCSTMDSVVITEPEVLEVMLAPVDGEFSCPDVTEGFIQATVSGGNDSPFLKTKSASSAKDYNPLYEFQLWQDGVMKSDYNNFDAFLVDIDHDYFVVVKDMNGCYDTSNVVTIDPVAGPEIVEIMDVTCDGDTAASVKVVVTGEEGRKFKVVWSQYEVESAPHSGETAWMPAGDIILDQIFKFDNESDDDQHYEIYLVDSMGCVSGKDSMTFDQVISSPLVLTVTEGAVNGCGTDVTISAAGGVAPYIIMVDDMEVMEETVVIGGGMHTVKVMDAHECMVMEELTLAYPMSRDTAVVTYTGEAIQFEDAETMLDTMLYVGEYSFYYDVDTACVAELNVVVTEKDRMMPVLDTVTPMDTIADNHPTFVITFEGPVTFNDSVMGNLTVTAKDSMEAYLTIPVTADMVSGNTITVTYVVADGELGLDKNTTYVVAVDSGIVNGDGLAWDGMVGDWMFTTGPDWATGITPEFAQDDFKVYPNPFNNYIKVDNYDKLSRVVITNIAGQRVLDIENPSYEIRTGNLVTGVYVVTLIKDNSIVKSERIIKR